MSSFTLPWNDPRDGYNIKKASPIINAVSVFRPCSTRCFGIYQFFVRYCGIAVFLRAYASKNYATVEI